MKMIRRGFRILTLTGAVVVLFSIVAAAQVPRDDDNQKPSSSSRYRSSFLRQIAATKPDSSLRNSASALSPTVSSAASCARMLSLILPDTQITSAQTIPADRDNGLPEYCEQRLGFYATDNRFRRQNAYAMEGKDVLRREHRFRRPYSPRYLDWSQ